MKQNNNAFMLLILMLTSLAANAVKTQQQPAPNPTTQAAPVLPANICNTVTPAMVVIRPGRFQMGSPENEKERSSDESPQHQVTIPRPFAISRCEITVAQFKKFIEETQYKTTAESRGKGCNVWNAEKKIAEQKPEYSWKNPGFVQTDNHPVVCVSWQDAQKYRDWLSQRTGAVYRLPTEAEWEYVARADTNTARYFGKQSQCLYANGLGQEAKNIVAKNWTLADCNDGFIYTAPVAHFQPNDFGLYDVLGNVLEWTLDCWHENYKAAPIDGSAWLEKQGGDCKRRVVLGGSWGNDPLSLRFGLSQQVRFGRCVH